MNLFLNEIEAIRKRAEPVIVYGNATLGKRIQAFLDMFGVEIAAVAVDRQLLATTSSPENYPLVAIEDCLSDAKTHNYVVAFNPRAAAASIKKKLQQNAKAILMYDFGYGVNDNIHYDLAFYNSYATYNKEALREVEFWLHDEYSGDTLAAFIEQKRTACFGIYNSYWTPNAYFPDEIITLTNDAVLVDGGAYTGDSVTAFLRKMERDNIQSYNAIYAFEPAPDSYQKLLASTASLQNCQCFQKGLWDRNARFSFNESKQNSALSETGDAQVEVVSIDEALQGKPATFIKMDIEGAELRALSGAKNTILQSRPKLAISIYHKAEDILTIPRFVKKLHPDYTLFMRCHSHHSSTDLVLYAV